MLKQTTHLLFSILFLSSCLKKEIPVPLPKPGNIETVVIEIGYPYLNQVYYNCETNKIVGTNTKYDWDLAFECSPNGYHILLNNAMGMLVANAGNLAFSSVTSTANATWLWDASSGNLDSTGIGDWKQSSNIYILDRQFNDIGTHLGYKKIQFLNNTTQSYTFKYANLDGSDENTFTINKNASLSFIHFSFNNGGKALALEPEKNSWDLLFTNHPHKFSNLPLPFVLTQVLTNKHIGVLVAEDNNNNFFKLTLKDTINYKFTNYWDEIGYDWKIRNNIDNSFTIDANKSFLIRTAKGLFYKIRFIDFYNNLGNKGYPTFEIQKL